MNNLTCWLVTCRPGTSVLISIEEPILPAHAAAIRSCRSPAIRAVARDLGPSRAIGTGRQEVAAWMEVALDERVSGEEVLGLLG